MAKVTMTLTDAVRPNGDNHIEISIESTPPLPLDGQRGLDAEDPSCTAAMAAAVLAANVVGQMADGDFSAFSVESRAEAEAIHAATRRGGQG
jgi:hypothetical protein